MTKKTKLADGAYQNLVTGMGVAGMDKTEGTRAGNYNGANVAELARMAVQDGVADRIVTMIPESSFSHDVSIIGDDNGVVLDAMEELGMVEAMESAGEMCRLSGGAVIVTEYGDVNKIGDLINPVRPNADIIGYRVYSASKVNLQKADFEGDNPRLFNVVMVDGSSVSIDPSRVTVVKGKTLPQELIGANLKEGYFGVSALKKCEKSIKRYANVMAAVATMATETGTKLFNLENFNELLSRPNSGIKDARDLVGLVSYSMNVNRSAFMGKDDKITILSHSFAGLPEVIKECKGDICADAGIPESLLFARTATGLSQTNDGDIKAYSETVEKWRKRYMARPFRALIADIAARNARKKDITGSFTWGPISVMTENELIEARAKQADTLSKYYQMGAISAEEIRDAVFINGHSFEISLNK